MKVQKSIKGTEQTWISMQKETFINWININLRNRGMAIDEIETAFEDGVKLVNLFEVISKQNIAKYNKTPRFANQKLENVALVLRAMELDGVKTVSIDSDHVVNGNFKMILGLIWQLILRYQVGGTEDDSIKIAVKKLLLIWLQHVIPEQNIRNLTTDWNTGIALCNLIDVLQPGLFPEYTSLNPMDKEDNIMKGLHIAEQALDIPQIISAENMSSHNVDELSMTTYLSYFTQDGGIGERWTLQLIQQWNSEIDASNFSTDWNDGQQLGKLLNTFAPGSVGELGDDNVKNCQLLMDLASEKFGIVQVIKPEEMANPNIPELAIMAYLIQFRKIKFQPAVSVLDKLAVSGLGLTGAIAGVPNDFTITHSNDLSLDSLCVEIMDSENCMTGVTFEDIASISRSYQYTLKEEGTYTISIKYKGEHISRSPYSIECLPNPGLWKEEGDTSPGTQLFAEISQKIGIGVDTRSAKGGTLTARTIGPRGIDVPTEVLQDADGNSTISFTPHEVGEYVSEIYWNGKEIKGSPFKIWIIDLRKCIVSTTNRYDGPIGHNVAFTLSIADAGPGSLTSYAEYLDEIINVQVAELEKDCYCCSFTPEKSGEYLLHVKYNESPIHRSPFRILVGDPKNVNVVIDDDVNRETNTRQQIILELLEGAGAEFLRCAITGPNEEEVASELEPLDNGKHSLTFIPIEEGRYQITIYYFGILLHKCPYIIEVVNPPLPEPPEEMEMSNSASLELSEEAINTGTHLFAEVNEDIGISIDTRKTGEGKLWATTIGPDLSNISTEVTKEENGTSTVSFMPLKVGMYQTNVYWNDKEIAGSPFRICINDFSKCVAKHTNTFEGQITQEMLLDISTAGAGPGTLTAHAKFMNETIDVRVIELEDECYCCAFTPTQPGKYLLYVLYNDTEIYGSPFKIKIIDPREIIVSIVSQTRIETLKHFEFTVLIPEGAGLGALRCFIDGPNGEKIPNELLNNGEGLNKISFLPPVDGSYSINLFYANAPLSKSPFVVNAVTPVNASFVVVSGEGLSEGFMNEVCIVNVDGRNAGPGFPSASVQGETVDVVAGIREESQGVYTISYTPPIEGTYLLNIKWNDEHVNGSPFKVSIQERANAENLLVGGEGLKEGTAGQPVLFTLDGRRAGPGALSCRCRAPSGKMTYILISDNQDGTYTVDLNATEPGLHTVDVEWDGESIPGSPFLVRIMQAPDVKKVRAEGPGLQSGVIDTFPGIFYVDTKGGGPGALKVRVHGPKECFKVQMYRNHPKDRVINVKYNPTIPGIYTVNVYWSDEHVEGSPFEVFIAANEEHLERWNENREILRREEGVH